MSLEKRSTADGNTKYSKNNKKTMFFYEEKRTSWKFIGKTIISLPVDIAIPSYQTTKTAYF